MPGATKTTTTLGDPASGDAIVYTVIDNDIVMNYTETLYGSTEGTGHSLFSDNVEMSQANCDSTVSKDAFSLTYVNTGDQVTRHVTLSDDDSTVRDHYSISGTQVNYVEQTFIEGSPGATVYHNPPYDLLI